MKVAVIGNGNVGKAVFRELQNFREINELVLVGRDAAACRAEAEDYMDAVPLRIDIPAKLDGGGFELAEGSDIVIYCAGPSVKKEDRLSIAEINITVMKEVFADIDRYAPEAIVIVVTNPLDVITTAIAKFTSRPASKVIGTGTLLDTARMVRLVAWAFKVSTENVDGYVIGEHGGSAVVLNSSITILGMKLEEYLAYECKDVIPREAENLEEDVRDAGFRIFRGKGYTSAGVAAAVARLVFDIVNDTHRMYPVSTVLNGEYGVNGYAISVPCMIGRNGIVSVHNIRMTDAEKEKFEKSKAVIEKICRDNGVL